VAENQTPAAPADDLGVLEDAFVQYDEAGLRLPPVPRALVAELDEFDDWYWGSEQLDLTDVSGFWDAARQPGGESAVAFGHLGHGVSSWWLCYRLQLADLAVFIRQGYGGVYADAAADGPRVSAVYEQLESLIPAAEAAKKAGRFQGGHRLIVVHDELHGSSWEIAGAEGDLSQPHKTGRPITQAMDFLSQARVRE
jgi:hypothetical protein